MSKQIRIIWEKQEEKIAYKIYIIWFFVDIEWLCYNQDEKDGLNGQSDAANSHARYF